MDLVPSNELCFVGLNDSVFFNCYYNVRSHYCTIKSFFRVFQYLSAANFMIVKWILPSFKLRVTVLLTTQIRDPRIRATCASHLANQLSQWVQWEPWEPRFPVWKNNSFNPWQDFCWGKTNLYRVEIFILKHLCSLQIKLGKEPCKRWLRKWTQISSV